MVDGQSGKGHRVRPFDPKKWAEGWKPLEKEKEEQEQKEPDDE